MNKRNSLFFSFFLFAFLANAQSSPILEKALRFSNFLVEQEADSAYSMLSKEVVSQITKEQLQEILPQVEKQMGKLNYRDEIRQLKEGQYIVTYQPFHFKKRTLDLKLVFNDKELISGLFFLPHQTIKLELLDTTAFYEEEIEVVTNKTFHLKGIATFPKKDDVCPAVVLVHGSGPNDMDETVGPNKLFRNLAHGLAERGVAVFRYDKRTHAYGGRPELDVQSMTLKEETIDDAITAVQLARKDNRIHKKQVYILGHSLGGMAAPKIASHSKHVKGIIIMGGNARPLEVLLKEQYEYLFNLDSVITEEEKVTLTTLDEQLNHLKVFKNTGKSENSLPLNLSEDYWNYLLNYDQVKTAKNLEKPILIVHGERDYQVTMKDFQKWQSALKEQPNVAFKLYEKLNHLMLEGTGSSNPEEYEIESPLPSYLLDDLAKWIKSNSNQ